MMSFALLLDAIYSHEPSDDFHVYGQYVAPTKEFFAIQWEY